LSNAEIVSPGVLDLVLEAVIETGPDFHVTGWNRGAQTIYGWTAEEALGRGARELLRSELEDSERARMVREVDEQGHVLALVRQRTRAGELIEVEASVSALRDAEGVITGYVCVSRDVTLRRRLEARLEETRDLELIARLAGGIAHDLNTLLTAILGYADLTLADPLLPGTLAADIEQISGAARRAGELTTQLVAFSRSQVLAARDVDLDEVIAHSLPARRRIAGKGVQLLDLPAPSATLVHLDPGQLQRVLLDIVANAAEAMPDGGRISFETTHEGRFARLAITDTGAGMDEPTRERAFQPFFTTKRGHTGLGLSSVHGIVHQSGGRVELASEPGTGTTVTLYLPLADAD
jgi:two-component system, cell cycle sensor histidine kinase and response regulator CckA